MDYAHRDMYVFYYVFYLTLIGPKAIGFKTKGYNVEAF